MARSNVISEFARRAWWLYVAETVVVLALLLVVRAYT
jgi:hypothetical protein